MEDITVKYKGLTIEYQEHLDKWEVADNGKWGSWQVDSLTEAKQWIDAMGKKEKKAVFKRVKALLPSAHSLKSCEVTSVSEEHGYRGSQYMVSVSYAEKGFGRERSKVFLDELRAYDEQTLQYVRECEKGIAKLEKEIERQVGKLKVLTLEDLQKEG